MYALETKSHHPNPQGTFNPQPSTIQPPPPPCHEKHVTTVLAVSPPKSLRIKSGRWATTAKASMDRKNIMKQQQTGCDYIRTLFVFF